MGGFSVLKHSSINGSINVCFSSCVVTINDWVITITSYFNCGIYFMTLKTNIFAPIFI